MLRAGGAELIAVTRQANGLLDLDDLLRRLAGRGVASLLVEGGSRILYSFLRARLVDWIVVTVAPRFIGGRPALTGATNGGLPGLSPARWAPSGPDLLVWGEPAWPSP